MQYWGRHPGSCVFWTLFQTNYITSLVLFLEKGGLELQILLLCYHIWLMITYLDLGGGGGRRWACLIRSCGQSLWLSLSAWSLVRRHWIGELDLLSAGPWRVPAFFWSLFLSFSFSFVCFLIFWDWVLCVQGWLWIYFVSEGELELWTLHSPSSTSWVRGFTIPCLSDLCPSCSVSLDSRALATAKSVTPTMYMLRQARYQRTTVGTTAHSRRSCEWMAHSFLVGLITQQGGHH